MGNQKDGPISPAPLVGRDSLTQLLSKNMYTETSQFLTGLDAELARRELLIIIFFILFLLSLLGNLLLMIAYANLTRTRRDNEAV
ncbi:hypothetical protein [Sphingobacterium daejeonense]|uniref:hypothetical protein n=1 Tax=Sphingobacterium daejeonense TaxID=371142 RepID=UPI0010FE3F17|nr:hypothetical protein [Sphingobacterium daejeonense]